MSESSSSITGESTGGADNMVPRPPGFLPPPDGLDELDDATVELFGLLAAPADPPREDPVDPPAVPPVIPKDDTDKALKLERFSGSPSSIRLVEWRRRFRALAAARGWPWATVLVKLKAFLTGPAARLIDVYQLPDDPRDAVDAVWRALDKAYGLTSAQALHRLRSVSYSPAQGSSVDELAASIVEWVSAAWSFLSATDRDAVAASIFWSALPRTSQTKHVYGQLTAGKSPGSLTLVASVEAARPLFEEERDSDVELGFVASGACGKAPPPGPAAHGARTGPYSRGSARGGKGRGRSRPSSADLERVVTSVVQQVLRGRSRTPGTSSNAVSRSVKCFACGTLGHIAKTCPQVQRSQVGGMLLLRCFPGGSLESPLFFLLDTGCSVTLLTPEAVSRFGTAASVTSLPCSMSSVQGLVGSVTAQRCVAEFPIGLGNVVLPSVLVLSHPLPSIQGFRVDGLLGMDFLFRCGGVQLSPGLAVDDPWHLHFPTSSPALGPLLRHDAHSFVTVPRSTRTLGVQVTDGVDCPIDRVHEIGLWRSDVGRVITDVVETSDFVVRRLATGSSPESPAYWEVEWKWVDGVPSRHIMPGDYGTAKFVPRLEGMWRGAVEEWLAEGWLVATALPDLHASSPLLLVPQEHKVTTPVRPVIDLTWLNGHVRSLPNELNPGPVACPDHLRRWRAFPASLEDLRLLDIRKAFLQIRVLDCQTYWLGLRLRWHTPEAYRMLRLPFGLAISPKCLSVVLSRILQVAGLDGQLDKYLDDLILPSGLVEPVRAALAADGFETKPPEALTESRVLGLQCDTHGRWSRRGPTPTLEQYTRRGVH
ncbi:hypothetical protein FOL47_001787, partial [Perkinsus chesapeaki]